MAKITRITQKVFDQFLEEFRPHLASGCILGKPCCYDKRAGPAFSGRFYKSWRDALLSVADIFDKDEWEWLQSRGIEIKDYQTARGAQKSPLSRDMDTISGVVQRSQ